MSHICDISPLRGSPSVPSCPNACNWCHKHKLMNVAKKVDVFSAALWPK